LAQYAVRLRFDDLDKQPTKKELRAKKTAMHEERVAAFKKKQRGKRSQMDPDFDSEEEYGQEGSKCSDNESSEEVSDVRSGSALGSHTPSSESEDEDAEPAPKLTDNYIMD
jgi:hypothetical protein